MFFCGSVLAARAGAGAFDASWNGGTGTWGNAGSWSSGTVPNNGDFVTIDSPYPAQSSVEITSDTPTVSITTLYLGARSFLTLDSGLTLNCGTVTANGTFTINNSAQLVVAPGSGFDGGTILLNGGSVNASTAVVGSRTNAIYEQFDYIGGYGSLNGVAAAIYNSTIAATNSGTPLNVSSYQGGAFDNEGTLTVNNHSTLNLNAATLSNSGKILATSGTINLNVSAVVNAEALNLQGQILTKGGAVNVAPNYALASDNEFVVSSGTLNFNKTLTTAGHTLSSASGSWVSLYALDNNNGTLNLAGTLVMGAATNAGGRILISGNAASYSVDYHNIDNTGGTLSVSTGSFNVINAQLKGGTFLSSSGGVMNVHGTNLNVNAITGISNLYNAGTINVGSYGEVAGTFNGSGTMTFQAGLEYLADGTTTFTDYDKTTFTGGELSVFNSNGGNVTLVNDVNATISGFGTLLSGSTATDRVLQNIGTIASGPNGASAATLNLTPTVFKTSILSKLVAASNSTLRLQIGTFSNLGTVNVQSGGTFSVAGTGGGTIAIGNITSAGTVAYSGASALRLSASGGTLNLNGSGPQILYDVNVAAINSSSGTVTLVSGSEYPNAVKTNALNVAQMDLSARPLLVDYTGASPLASLTAELKAGYKSTGGAWSPASNAIFSSSAAADPTHHAIGIAELSSLYTTVPATYSGQSVDSTTIVMRYTFNGDANLDGKVNIGDLGILASHWQLAGGWAAGDFNYDGKIDIGDLGILATNWQAGANSASVSFAQALAEVGLPEPSLVYSAALLLMRRRQRDAYC